MKSGKIFWDYRDIHRIGVLLVNGCFDLLTVAHIRFLEKAKLVHSRSELTPLVVAVNSDESVRRLKGNGRPVNTIADRMEMLAALQCVDIVTKFSEDNAASVILELFPSTWAKSWPYTMETINSEELAAAKKTQTEIVILEKFGDYSTTAILERIKA